jgi:transglutaminase-like putative cysteine protease
MIQVAVRRGELADVADEAWDIDPPATIDTLPDLYGNDIHRTVLPAGDVRLRYDARVRVPSCFDESDPDAPQHPVEQLPAEAVHYLLASRYCHSDTLTAPAWSLFGQTPPGWGRVQAISDWVHDNVEFQYGSSDSDTDAVDVYERRRGVCRDLTHLFISFCRAMNIPTRYVFGYLPDILVEPPPEPMDFCAWAEVYLGQRWWTFDPRNNRPRAGRVVIGRGRDAVDVAMMTIWGNAVFKDLTVWAEEVGE